MKNRIYNGKGLKEVSPSGIKFPRSPRRNLSDPSRYIADEGIIDAFNAALLLNQPLLLTGEPGTGKTDFARSVSWEFSLGEPPDFEPLIFHTKSTSEARDLLYVYDSLKRFEDIQAGLFYENLKPYIRYGPLGKSILRSNEKQKIVDLLPDNETDFSFGKKSVVLIDEIDKASRDFPNDLLYELDRLTFQVHELGDLEIKADEALTPIVIVTSNSEKDLPEPFLRRCVYYHIPFPNRDELHEIATRRLMSQDHSNAALSESFIDDALDFFLFLREPSSNLKKPPSTAELLCWMVCLRRALPEATNPLDNNSITASLLGTLVKTEFDAKSAKQLLQTWKMKRRN